MLLEVRTKLRLEVAKVIAISFALALILHFLFSINFAIALFICMLIVAFKASWQMLQKIRSLIEQIIAVSVPLDEQIEAEYVLHSVRGYTNEYIQKLNLGASTNGLIVAFKFGINKKPYLISWETFSDYEILQYNFVSLTFKTLDINFVIPYNEELINRVKTIG